MHLVGTTVAEVPRARYDFDTGQRSMKSEPAISRIRCHRARSGGNPRRRQPSLSRLPGGLRRRRRVDRRGPLGPGRTRAALVSAQGGPAEDVAPRSATTPACPACRDRSASSRADTQAGPRAQGDPHGRRCGNGALRAPGPGGGGPLGMRSRRKCNARTTTLRGPTPCTGFPSSSSPMNVNGPVDSAGRHR